MVKMICFYWMMWFFKNWHLKFLFIFCFCLPVLASSSPVCQSGVRKLLSTSSQQHFLKADFLPKMFEELADIAEINDITITNVEVRKILFHWSSVRSPGVVDLFEVAGIFGVKASDLFQYTGNLREHVNPAGIVKDRPLFTHEERRRILQAASLHLSGLINKVAHKRNLSLKKLAFQLELPSQYFHDIAFGIALPRLNWLLQTLVRLDADVVSFFKNIETNLKQSEISRPVKTVNRAVLWDQGEIKDFVEDVSIKIDRDLKKIFKETNFDNPSSDIVRFEKNFHFHSHYVKNKTVEQQRLPVARILQIANMLGINPSEVFKYAGNLESRVQLSGIQSRTLLSKEEMNILIGQVQQHFVETIKQSEKTLEELSAATEIPVTYLRNIHWRETPPRVSVMERILRALGKNCVEFFEELESLNKIGISSNRLKTLPVSSQNWSQDIEDSNQFIGGRIMEIREILNSVASFNKINQVTAFYRRGKTARGKKTSFSTLYKFSRVTDITLSDLVSERSLKGLVNPQNAKFEKVFSKDIEKAEQFLAHLLLSEARRQKDIHGLTISGLAIKAHFLPGFVRNILSGRLIPSYPFLRRLVENGLGIPLEKFLLDFEGKLRVFNSIPAAETQMLLAGLKGNYLGSKVQERLDHVRKRVDLARDFFQSVNIPLSKFKELAGDSISPRRKRIGVGHGQVYTVMKCAHFLGVSMRDFLGHRPFAELVDIEKLNFEILPEEQIRKMITELKKRIDRHRESLRLSKQDFRIMSGEGEYTRGNLFFPWRKYFQTVDILAHNGEDDLFLLDDLGPLAGGG